MSPTNKHEEKKDENVEVNELEIDDIGIRMKGLNSKTRTEYGIPKNVDGVVVTAVKRDSFAAKAGLNSDKILTFESVDEAAKDFKTYLTKGDLVLLKGSRGIGLERLLESEGPRGDCFLDIPVHASAKRIHHAGTASRA